jgi:hypothetical protein
MRIVRSVSTFEPSKTSASTPRSASPRFLQAPLRRLPLQHLVWLQNLVDFLLVASAKVELMDLKMKFHFRRKSNRSKKRNDSKVHKRVSCNSFQMTISNSETS